MKKLNKIANENGIHIVEMKMKGEQEALCCSVNNSYIIAIDPTKVKSKADLLVKSAHELGHCMTGSVYCMSYMPTPRERLENRADKWAIMNLIPVKNLKKALREGNTTLWELAEYFGVTEDFMVKALKLYNMWNGE